MKAIETGETRVKRLLGKQESVDTEYRMMKYTLRAECEDGTLLHNVMTGQMILLSEAEAKVLDKLPARLKPEMEMLIADYYLVPREFNERATVQQLRKLMKRLFPAKGINSYLILTTTNCNARCAYCFENGIRRINMEADTAKQVADYIAANMSKEEAELHWFGGEPLLGAERIDQICKALEEQGIQFRSSMTTNGYLFNDDFIQKATEAWNLGKVQITLDGTEAIYNRIKRYAAVAESPYQRVMGNTKKLLDAGIQVMLRLHMDEENEEDLRQLAEELSERFSGEERLNVYASKIQKERMEEAERKLNQEVAEFNDFLEQIGLGKHKPQLLSLQLNSCMADSEETVVIFPDGRLGKCEDVHDEDAFGRIGAMEVNEKGNAFCETFEYEYCKRCPIYPSCILLRKCPTKQREQYEVCQKSIQHYLEDLVLWYKNIRNEQKICETT